MSSEKTSMSAPVHAIVMQLFREQALTIGKSGDDVLIQCGSGEDANTVFEWLAGITGQYGTVDDWLDEIESFSLRRERIDNPRVVEPWVRAAFDAGCSRESA